LERGSKFSVLDGGVGLEKKKAERRRMGRYSKENAAMQNVTVSVFQQKKEPDIPAKEGSRRGKGRQEGE